MYSMETVVDNIVIPPYLWLYFPWFQLPMVKSSLKILSEQLQN